MSWRLALLSALVATVQLSGCASATKEESPDTTAERLYKEARDDIESGTYERAIKTLERVESLAAGSLLGQQALLDTAYIHWRNGERTEGLAAIDRFIKLNPSSPRLRALPSRCDQFQRQPRPARQPGQAGLVGTRPERVA
jgi:outer membrane protein assembly factor BamD